MAAAKYARSALFVDFDNIFLSLRDQVGLPAAHRFANNPQIWLDWLEKQLSLGHMGEDFTARRILIRKCYLNPTTFGKFRPYFTQAAFEVVDCPPLTQGGKTSADIHMVMDIMDTLDHPARYDEFILLSADADFTPVLLRVRHFDRRSVVLAAGFPSPAYKSACDFLPSINTFLQEALGIHPQDEDDDCRGLAAPVTTPEGVLERLADLLWTRTRQGGVINAYELPTIYKKADEFCKSSSWLEFRSLRRLTEAVVRRRDDLAIEEDIEEGNWGVRMIARTNPPPAEMRQEAGAEIAAEGLSADYLAGELTDRVAAFVVDTVRNAPEPIVMGTMAEQVRKKFGSELSAEGWMGAPTFKSMLEHMDLAGLKISNAIPGYLYDPTVHSMDLETDANGNVLDAKSRLTAEFKHRYAHIQPLAYKIYQLTDLPYLLPEHYAQVLIQLARTINDEGYNLSLVTRLVRDRCVERGIPVSRKQINFIVVGISYSGYKMGQPGQIETPGILAEQLYRNALNLCQSAQFTLEEEEQDLLRQWLIACLDEGLEDETHDLRELEPEP